MQELLNRIRHGLARDAYPNERAVSTSIVVPVLRALGWDDSDPETVRPEYATGRGRVDYALSARQGSPAIFVEVKGVGKSGEADRQLFEYAFHEGAQIAVLTDGRIWNFYLPGQFGSYDERRVFQLDLLERPEAEAEARFTRYLARGRVLDGSALHDASADYQDQASRRRAAARLPDAWRDLLALPDADLVRLLQDRVEALSGHRPSDEAVTDFLATQNRLGTEAPPSSKSGLRAANLVRHSQRTTVADVAVPPMAEAPTTGSRNSWRIANERGEGKNQLAVWLAFLTHLFERYPDKREAMAAAVRTRSRNNIARDIAAIYPAHPEIAARQHQPLPGGWHLGTNESAGTKLRIARLASEQCGLRWGIDADLSLSERPAPDNA